jgi:CHRD domain
VEKPGIRRSVSIVVLLLATAVTATATADNNRRPSAPRYVARLVPMQEVPAVSSSARGSFTATLDEDAQTISYELKFEGLEGAIAQAHIHTAQVGVNGGIMVWLCGTPALPGPIGTPVCPTSPGTVTGVLTPAQVIGPAGQGIGAGEFAEVVAAIQNGLAYANVHSAKFAGGEIRGQIRRGWRDFDD